MNFINGGNYEQRIFSVLQKNIKQIRRFTGGGVLNVQSTLTGISNNGTVRSVQKGVINKDMVLNNSSGEYSFAIPVSMIKINKCVLFCDMTTTDTAYATISRLFAQIQNGQIVVTFQASIKQSARPAIMVYGNWQIVEFY